jgi:hypothetical protein
MLLNKFFAIFNKILLFLGLLIVIKNFIRLLAGFISLASFIVFFNYMQIDVVFFNLYF